MNSGNPGDLVSMLQQRCMALIKPGQVGSRLLSGEAHIVITCAVRRCVNSTGGVHLNATVVLVTLLFFSVARRLRIPIAPKWAATKHALAPSTHCSHWLALATTNSSVGYERPLNTLELRLPLSRLPTCTANMSRLAGHRGR
jgi:hypothetical protein